MHSELEERVRTLVDGIKSIEKESEGVYLSMGRLFPALMSETVKCARVAEESLSSFDSARTSSGRRDLEEMRSFAAGAGDWFRKLHERDDAFLDRINDSIERLSALDGLIQGVRSDSEEMEIISLNAMTVALKSGHAGKAFSVITDELKRLSGQTIQLTETITGRGRALLDSFGRLRDSLGELDRYQDGFFGRLETTLNGSFGRLENDLVDARRFFTDLVSKAKDLREPVQRIMQEVQHQDIVRQSLDHVAISLGEAESAARNGAGEKEEREERAFIVSVAKLSASLLEDIVAKLETSSASFEQEIEDVEGRVGRIEERRNEYRSGHASLGLEGEGGGEAGAGEGELGEGSARYLVLKKSVFSTARRLADQVRVLDDSFKNLAALLARFKNIVVASRIEIAKNHSLGSVTTTVQGMVTLTGRIESDVSGAMATTKDFIKVAMAAIDEYAEGSRDRELGATEAADPMIVHASVGQTGIASTLERIEGDIADLRGQRRATSEAIEAFTLFTPEFLGYIEESRRELASLRRLSERLRGAKVELEGLGASLLESLGGKIDREIHGERLKAMIQRFTILTHKRAAGELGNFDVEDGVEVGEVTLF